MMPTLQVLAERFGYEDLAVAFPEADIPVLTGVQRQGDVLVLPAAFPARWPRTGPVPLDGVVVVASEVSDHTHALHGDGQVLLVERMSGQRARWWRTTENTLGWLLVPAGGQAFLMHSQEHGALGIGPGGYQILQQQEFNSYVQDWLPVGN
jgi:hypothetical protein